MIRLSSFPRYLAWPGAPGVAQRHRKPSVSMGRRPSVKSRSPVLGRRLWPHTSSHPPPTPPCYLGTEKEGKRPPWYLVPSSQALPADHLRKEKTLPTHTHSYNPQSHLVLQPGHPGVFAGPGRDAGEKSTGSTQGRNQPWETHGQGEEEESEESPCKNPEVGHFLAKSTRACGRLLARDPTSSLTDARAPSPAAPPRLQCHSPRAG